MSNHSDYPETTLEQIREQYRSAPDYIPGDDLKMKPYLTGACSTHRHDEFTIICKIARLLLETADLPTHVKVSEHNCKPVKTPVMSQARAYIMDQHCFDDMALYYWFESRAVELLEAAPDYFKSRTHR